MPINGDHEPDVLSSKRKWQTQAHVLEGPASKRAVDVAELKLEVVGRLAVAKMFLSACRRGGV
jgi:hypothetical protein